MKKNQYGFSLIMVMVTAGILGILVVVGTTFMKNAFSGHASNRLRGERDAIGQMLLRGISCRESLAPGTCPSGTYLQLKRKDGAVVIGNSSPGTKLGRWTVRAQCNAANDGIDVRVAVLKSGGTIASTNASDFEPDPLTKRISTWANATSLLYPSGVGLCKADWLSSVPTITSVYSSTILPVGNHGCNWDQELPRNATAVCPANTSILAGGVKCGTPGLTVSAEISENFPDSVTNGWVGSCCGVPVTVYAVCI